MTGKQVSWLQEQRREQAKWKELVDKLHSKEVQKKLAKMFEEELHNINGKPTRRRIVLGTIFHFQARICNEAFGVGNLISRNYREMGFRLRHIPREDHNEYHNWKLKYATFLREIDGLMPKDLYIADDVKPFTLRRAKESVKFLESCTLPSTENEFHKAMWVVDMPDRIDKDILQASYKIGWEKKFIEKYLKYFYPKIIN